MYKAIMLPIDLAHDSSWKKAIPVARILAETFGAKLHAISVVQDIRNAVVSQYFPKDYEETLARDAAEKLSALIAAELPGIEVTEHIAIGAGLSRDRAGRREEWLRPDRHGVASPRACGFADRAECGPCRAAHAGLGHDRSGIEVLPARICAAFAAHAPSRIRSGGMERGTGREG